MNVDALSTLFRIGNEKLMFSTTQLRIFEDIITRKYPRIQVILPTQYGKSLVVACGLIIRAVVFDEKWIIVAPSEKKAKIIMGYVIEHLFDNPFFYTQLVDDDVLRFKKLKREKSKNKITFNRGGSIETLTLDSRNSQKSLEAAMGFGGPNIVLDESSLVDDPLYSSVKRMLGGHKDNFMFEIGNPFYRNHFHRTWTTAKNYHKIFLDYHGAIKEGRFDANFIDEMRDEAFFDVYYECKFPDEDMIDSKGYRQLLTSDVVNRLIVKQLDMTKVKGIPHLGADIGGGGDYNAFIKRWSNAARVHSKNRSNDTMMNVTEMQDFYAEDADLEYENMHIDDIGIGRGVTDRCKELDMDINGVSAGSTKGVDTLKYQNIKAKLSWQLRKWIMNDCTQLEEHVINHKSVWDQLTWIKYKVNSDKQVKIEPKSDLVRRTNKSPDFYEGLMLSKYQRPYIGFS